MRVALYVRVSTEEQAVHGLSVDDQKESLKKWAEENKHKVVDYYVDAGVSGRKSVSKRPELQRLLSDVEAGKIDLVAFTKLDRWFRNIGEFYKAQEVLDTHGVVWQATYEDYETATAAGRLKVNIMLSVAQDEADRTSERVKRIMQHKRELGLCPAGKTPIGLKAVESRLCIDEETAHIARRMFEDYIATGSVNHVKKMLVSEFGIMRANHHIKCALSNERYIGLNNGIKVCDALIPPEDFALVQRMLTARSVRNNGSRHTWLFSGLVWCAECGHRLVTHSTRQRGTDYFYYRCKNYEMGICRHKKRINEATLEKYLLAKLPIEVQAHNAKLKAGKTKPPVDTAAIKRKMDKLTDLYLADLISREKYEMEYTSLKEKLNVPPEPKPINEELVMSVLDAYDKLPSSGKKEVWNRFIRRIVVSENGDIFFELVWL